METGPSGAAPGAALPFAVLPAQALAFVACATLFLIMALTFLDVIGRYFLAAPLPAAYELVSFGMPAIIFCALPLVNLREEHVTVDLLDSFTPAPLRRLQGAVVNLIAAGATGFIAWRLWARSADQARFSEVTEALWLPLWPFSLAMAGLAALAALASLAAAVAWALRGAARP